MTEVYTVERVRQLFETTVIDGFAATDEGQKHLNRIAKAITNESIEARKKKSYETYAQKAFDKKFRELSATDSEKAQALAARATEWKEAYIKKNYLDKDEEF